MSKKRKKRAQISLRVNILFFGVFILFAVLILQLGVVQILNGEDFQEEIERTNLDTTKIPVPRGKIYDSNGNVIVDNEAVYSITYTPPKGVQAENKLKVAEKLANYIEMDDEETLDGITERNKKEYWYLRNQKKADGRISEEQKEELDNADVYNATLDAITEEEITNFSKQELEVIAIKKELDKAYSLTPQIVKNENVTVEEYAAVAENLDELPGINATTDWNREYPYESALLTLLGSITSQEQGIPAEKEDTYLSKGYSRNDRVGTSGLEQQYEDVLRGRKEQIEYTTKKNGTLVDSKTIVEGQRGKDLVLTIDMEFQQQVDKIVQQELESAIRNQPYENRFLEDALVVAMNPQTGELLAVSGSHYNREKNEFEDAAHKTLYDANRPGSSVKGATVLAGYQSGAISPGDVFFDSPIKIRSTPEKSSAGNSTLGYVNDYDALKRSSNVYMFYIALRMGGEYRHPLPRDTTVDFDTGAYQELRNYFRQFGLGARTGIDYPYESTGYVGPSSTNAGLLMDFAIGQYDTYTTMQMAQYVATIANDGYRVKPHFVKSIHEPIASQNEIGPVYSSNNTTVMNRIEMSDDNIKRVQEGFRQVFQETRGTASGTFANKPYNAAGKTGTAQNTYYTEEGEGYDTLNSTLVGYAPYDDPEIAFAVVVPNLGLGNTSRINQEIGEGLLDTYFEIKENPDQAQSDNEQEDEEEETEQ